MKQVIAITAVLLFMAQVAMPQGMLFNAGACYVSSQGSNPDETNTTFQSASRPCRIWGTTYCTLVRFDATDLSQINAPCTLFVTKHSNTPATTVWGQANIEIYLLKGTWQEGSNDADQVNLTGTASWNYRMYPTAWNTSGIAPGPITSAMARKNTTNMNGGPDLNTPATVVLDPVIVDSLKTGRFTGVMLKPGGGAMYWVTHIGHWLSWGEIGVEANVKSVSALSLSASPNPFTSGTALSVSLRSTDRNATLCVYNLNGQKVADLSAQLKSGASSKVSWNASTMPNGVYMAKLVSGNIQLVKRLTLMK